MRNPRIIVPMRNTSQCRPKVFFGTKSSGTHDPEMNWWRETYKKTEVYADVSYFRERKRYVSLPCTQNFRLIAGLIL